MKALTIVLIALGVLILFIIIQVIRNWDEVDEDGDGGLLGTVKKIGKCCVGGFKKQ